MFEAAVAFAECTGKTALLDVACRMADHIYRHFITEGNEGFCGHPEVELALMRLYRQTGEPRYLALTRHFIDTRGSDYFIRESAKWPWVVWGNDPLDREYTQTHLPVREQKDAVGHAVRGVYLYAGMADVALETKDDALSDACRALWQSITRRRMYVTGSIGSAYEGECFTKDYHLPNDTAYAETCASVGLIFFARRMLALQKRGEYADVMERALYNGVLAGMQLDGKRFFYVNPLEALPGISGEAVSHCKALPERPQVVCLRLLPAERGAAADIAWPLRVERGGEYGVFPSVYRRALGAARFPRRRDYAGYRLPLRGLASLPGGSARRRYRHDAGHPYARVEP